MSIQLTMNPERLVGNLKNAFSTRTTFIAELMQNARRSKSPYVGVLIDHDNLQVRDEGCGIVDMQNLFSIADTGWDNYTQLHEKPFGMGWLSALFAAEYVLVESWGQRIFFRTSDALCFRRIEVEDCPFMRHTVIELYGLNLRGDEMEQAVIEYARGFSIPVNLTRDGRKVDVPREHALDRKTFVELDTCWIRPYLGSRSFCVYLQDVSVYQSAFCGEKTIVHLKPRYYEAKMPDRDKLIDQDQALTRIEMEITGYIRETLEREKTRLAPEKFIDSYYEEMKTWRMFDLLNDIDIIPLQWLLEVCDYPVADKAEYGTELDYMAYPPRHVLRTDIETGKIRIVTVDCDSSAADGFKLKMFMHATGILRLEKYFDDGHWVASHRRVAEINEADVEVQIINEHKRVHYSGSWVSGGIVFCEAYKLILDTGRERITARITDAAINPGDDQWVIVPAGETSSQVIDQCSEFYFNDYEYAEHAAENEHEDFLSFIRFHQADDPQSYLKSNIRKILGDNLKHLAGLTFIVAIPADDALKFEVARVR